MCKKEEDQKRKKVEDKFQIIITNDRIEKKN
jgi:hypothetical protein